MEKILIVTDTTSYLKKEYIEKEGIKIVPLNYIFGDQEYKEGLQGDFDEFYERLSNSNLFPKTSQPSSGDFVKVFEKGLEEYDHIIGIFLSSKISGTVNSANLAKDILGDKKITIIDSLVSAASLRFLVERAVEMIKEKCELGEIINELENLKLRQSIYITTDTLEYLKRGGRLSGTQAALGNMLNIKPILELKNGELGLLEKLRGKNKAINKIISFIPEDVKRISICHILNREEADKYLLILGEKFPQANIEIDDLGPVIGSHLGPKTIGFCFY